MGILIINKYADISTLLCIDVTVCIDCHCGCVA